MKQRLSLDGEVSDSIEENYFRKKKNSIEANWEM